MRSCISKLALAAVLALLASTSSAAVVTSADIVFIVDESGSMSTEHAFLSSQIANLDSGLAAAGVTTRNYGVVGFGGNISGNGPPRAITGALTTLGNAQTAISALTVNGGTEDGWRAMQFALTQYSFTGQAINFILVTDEDRDNTDPSVTYASLLANLDAQGVVLNAIVNANLRNGVGQSALGVDSDRLAYIADGAGGFTTSAGGSCSGGDGATCAQYVDLAWATGGAAWDLNALRAGGNLATSFTNAFLEIKVAEISNPVPEPGTLLLLGSGIAAMALRRRRS